MMIGAKLADAIDKSAAKSSQLAQFLSIQDLKSMSLPEIATFLSQTLAETGGPNSEGLAKALALQAVLSNSNSDPIKLAKSLRVTNGLVKAGVPKSTVTIIGNPCITQFARACQKFMLQQLIYSQSRLSILIEAAIDEASEGG